MNFLWGNSMTTIWIRANCCPECDPKRDYKMRARGAGYPMPGNLSICWACASVHEFGEDLKPNTIQHYIPNEIEARLQTLRHEIERRIRTKPHPPANRL